MDNNHVLDLDIVDGGLIERFNVRGLAPAVGMYKHVTAKRHGSSDNPMAWDLEISGMLALDETGKVTGSTCFDQVMSIIENITLAIVRSAAHFGKELSEEQARNHVTSTMVLLSDMDDFGRVNEAFKQGGLPMACRAAFAAGELPLKDKGILVEIRVNACIPA